MTTHRSLERLIEDQIQSWSLDKKIAGTTPRVYRPLITISRTFGARGAALARNVAARAGFALWDRELVRAIAEAGRSDQDLTESLDERRRAVIDEAVRHLIVRDDVSNVRYYRSLMHIIKTLARHGSAVVVGRGANFALRPSQALRVRVTAPVGWRIQGVAERNDQSLREAEAMVVQSDSERADFVSYYFHQDIDSAEHYDLVLNASRFSLDHMAEMVLHAYADCFDYYPVAEIAS